MTKENLRRLYQPENPLFWLMVALNLLSSILLWMLHSREWPVSVTMLLAAFALGNAVLGIGLLLRLLKGKQGK